MLVHLNANPMDPEFERILYTLIGSGGIKKVISIVRKVLLPIFQTLENNIKLGVEKGEFETQDALLAALEIFIFCTHYRSFYKFFENSNWYEHLYGEGSANIAFDFFIRHTLKALCPEGKKLILPVIPENMLYEFDKKIDSIIHELQGGQKEDDKLPQAAGN